MKTLIKVQWSLAINNNNKQEHKKRVYIVIFAATVSAEASDAAVDHLDAAQYHLQHAQTEQHGEQHDVPRHDVGGFHTQVPQRLVEQVASLSAAQRRTLKH